jgi:hypothetical protein
MFQTEIDTVFGSSDLFNTLDIISDNEARTISLIPFGSVFDMAEKLVKRRMGNRTARKLEEKDGLVLFLLESYEKKGGVLRSSGKFLLHKVVGFEYSYLIITFEESDFFHRELRPFIKSFYSEVIFSFIKSHDLIKLIENYQSSNTLSEIKITRASQKIRYGDESTMSTVTWNNSSLEEAYLWLRDNNGFFKSIQFRGYRGEFEVANVFLDRRGIVRTDRNFIRVFNSLVMPTFVLIDRYIKLFNNRGRRDNALLEVRPLELNFSDEIFKNKENHKRFIEIVSHLKDVSVSVMHGNPYIHLAIIDYVDASSYDLWVVDSKQILLVPQLRSSIISLKRLISHIFDNYAEGEIENHEN